MSGLLCCFFPQSSLCRFASWPKLSDRDHPHMLASWGAFHSLGSPCPALPLQLRGKAGLQKQEQGIYLNHRGCLTPGLMSQVHPQQSLSSHKRGLAPLRRVQLPALLCSFPSGGDQWSSPQQSSDGDSPRLQREPEPATAAAVRAGGSEALLTHWTAAERLLWVCRDHPAENETWQEPSGSNGLWLPGDTTQSAALNANPLGG